MSSTKQDQLQRAGLKITTPRIKILQLLEQTDARHISAEEIYQMLSEVGEEVGLATVYRVLTQFESAGIVKRHNFENNRSIFELNQGMHHDHLVCVKCGNIEEFVDDVIETRQKAIAKKAQFTITDHSLNIYGVCHTCQQQPAAR